MNRSLQRGFLKAYLVANLVLVSGLLGCGILVVIAAVRSGSYVPSGEPTVVDASQTMTYVNQTAEPLQFYGQFGHGVLWKDRKVPAHSERTFTRIITTPRFRVVAESLDGKIVFDRTYEWSELKQIQKRIVVSSLDPIR